MQTTIKGKPFQVASSPADYWGWIAEGRYDHEWKVYDAHLRPEHTFIDLGAWVGAHSLYASTIARRVYAVEPDPVAFSILEQNVKGLPIHICRAAITGYRGEIKLGSGWLGASTTRANPNAGSGIGPWVEEQICISECTTLRDFVGDMPSGVVNIEDCNRKYFIKMDVEGSEEDILKDVAFFAEHKPTMLIELHPFWWRDEQQAWKDFSAVKALYSTAYEVPHTNSKTWVLA